jgi:hypothetical protein
MQQQHIQGLIVRLGASSRGRSWRRESVLLMQQLRVLMG